MGSTWLLRLPPGFFFVRPLTQSNINIFLILWKNLALEKFFFKAVKTLHSNGNSSVKMRNGSTLRFDLKRGIRQGCPISPNLFLLCAQNLTTHISNSAKEGITTTELLASKDCSANVKQEVTYLGLLISRDKKSRCSSNFTAILQNPPPQKKKTSTSGCRGTYLWQVER